MNAVIDENAINDAKRTRIIPYEDETSRKGRKE